MIDVRWVLPMRSLPFGQLLIKYTSKSSRSDAVTYKIWLHQDDAITTTVKIHQIFLALSNSISPASEKCGWKLADFYDPIHRKSENENVPKSAT